MWNVVIISTLILELRTKMCFVRSRILTFDHQRHTWDITVTRMQNTNVQMNRQKKMPRARAIAAGIKSKIKWPKNEKMLTIIVLPQWAVSHGALSMKRRVPIQTKVAVGGVRAMACLAWDMARLTAPPTGVTEGLLWALFNTSTSWQDREELTLSSSTTVDRLHFHPLPLNKIWSSNINNFNRETPKIQIQSFAFVQLFCANVFSADSDVFLGNIYSCVCSSRISPNSDSSHEGYCLTQCALCNHIPMKYL